MPISLQKKVGIIIIALLLLGGVALLQTGKIQIPGLKSDALNTGNCTGTMPTNAILQPADVDSGDHIWHMDWGPGPYASCTFKCPDGYAYKNNACTEYKEIPHIEGVNIVYEKYNNDQPPNAYVRYMIQWSGFGIGWTVNIDRNISINNAHIEVLKSSFGSYAYLSFQHTLLNAEDPFSTPGQHILTITNKNGISNDFTFDFPLYLPYSTQTKPIIYQISPSYGKIGEKIAIRAINFSPFTPNTKVIFRWQNATRNELDFDSNWFFTIPDKMSNGSDVTPGNYSISVKNPNGEQSDEIISWIIVIWPKIDQYPSDWQVGGQFTIYWSGFTSSSVIHIGSNIVRASSASSDGNSLTFIVPDVAPGNYEFYLENSNGRSDKRMINILQRITITSITPDHGPVGTTVTIQGTRFWEMSQGAYKNLIEFGSTQLYVDRSRDGSTLTFTIPEHLGSCDGTNCPLINTTPRVYNIFVRNGEGLSSDAIPFTVTSTTTIPTTTTPSVPTAPTTTPTTPSPQAHVSVGGSNNATVKVGDKVTYTWSAMDATSATSTYTASPSRCGAGGAWLANTTSGSLTSDRLPASYAGCTFTIKYTSKNAAGTTAEDTLVLTIQWPPEPTATLKVNGSTGTVTVRVGEIVKYEWSSTAAESATSTYTATPSRCGAGGAWIIKKPNGTLTAPALPASYAGCVFTLNFTANQTNTGKKATSTVVMTIQ